MQLRAIIRNHTSEFTIDCLRIVDFLILMALGYVTFIMRHGISTVPLPLQISLLICGPVIMAYGLSIAGFYRKLDAFNPTRSLHAILIGEGITIMVLFSIGYFAKVTHEYSRLWILLWILLTPLTLISVRMVVGLWLRRNGLAEWETRRIILIGAEPLLSAVNRQLESQTRDRVNLLLSVDMGNVSVDAALESINRCCDAVLPDDFILAMPSGNLDFVHVILPHIRQYWASINICPEHSLIGLPFQEARHIGSIPVLRLMKRPFDGWQGVVKWLEDQVLASIILVLMLPVMVLIALAVLVDSPGPVLFRQNRYGFGGREFVLYKFRTMTAENADRNVRQARRDDPRVTRIGRLLRKTSLDELPQLFNVLCGDMSLVGPRPHAVTHGRHFAPIIKDYLMRYRVKPGITGWAQVNGFRGETTTLDDMQKRIQYDVSYIENWSVILDMSILVQTVLLSFCDERAY